MVLKFKKTSMHCVSIIVKLISMSIEVARGRASLAGYKGFFVCLRATEYSSDSM